MHSQNRTSPVIPALLAILAVLAVASASLHGSPAQAVGPYPDFTPPRTINMASCPGVALVGSRGSGEAFDDGSLGVGGMGIKPLFDRLVARLGPASVGSSAVSYPAVPFLISPDQWPARADLLVQSFGNLVNMLLPGGYSDSVLTGRNDGASDITHLAVRCPQTKIVVAGASQGAHAAKLALNRLNASAGSHVSAVVLMGDATFDPNEPGVQVTGGTGPGTGIARLFYPSIVEPLQSRYAGKVISSCHNNDPICRTGKTAGVSGHNYVADADSLAGWVIGRLFPPQGSQPPCVAFAADVTVPDGSVLAPGNTVTKTWQLRNCSRSNWTGVTAVRIAGAVGPTSFAVPVTPPGGTATVSVSIVVPRATGSYRSTYKLANSGGNSTGSFWVDFTVPSSPSPAHDCAAFVADITVPDGTTVDPGSTVTKTWRLRNCGNTNWSGLTAVRVNGNFGPAAFPVPVTAPGGTAEISVAVVVPSTAGHYRTTYRLQGGDGHFADNSFWIDINVALSTPPNRQAVTSYDRMAPGAPYHGYFTAAWQGFVAQSNRVTLLGVTVGNPSLPAGQAVAASMTIRLCGDPRCSTVLSQGTPQIVNYGNTSVDIGNVAVTPGSTYFIVWYQPAAVNGTTWVTYWWAGGPSISQSDQMQSLVRGYNA